MPIDYGNGLNEEDDLTPMETRAYDIFGQTVLLWRLLENIWKAGVGKILIIFSLLFLLALFMLVSVYGGILAGIASVLALLILLVYVLAPWFEIRTIPPIYIGVPLVIGKRQKKYILGEGKTFYIKHIFEYMPVYVGAVNLDFSFTVRDNQNFQLKLFVSASIQADKDNIIKFLDQKGVFGEDNEEKEGEHGIADKIIDLSKAAMMQSSKELNYDEIMAIDDRLGNSALQRITDSPEATIHTLTPGTKHKVDWLGIVLYTFLPYDAEPLEELSKVLSKLAKEKVQREYQTFDAATQRIVYYTMQGEEDPENPISPATREEIEDFFLILKQQENEEEMIEKGIKFTPGLGPLLIRVSRLVQKGVDISEIVQTIRRFTGGSR